MKITQITKYYYPHRGGIETYVQLLAEELTEKADIEIVTANNMFKTEKEISNGIKIRRLPRLFKLFSTIVYPSLFTWLKRSKADIYHLHMPDPFSAICFLLAKPKGKLVLTWHSDIVKQKLLLKFYKPFQDMMLEEVDKIIVTSPNYLQSSTHLSKFKDKCEIVPLGIDIDQFKVNPKIKEKVSEIKNKYPGKLILFVGRLIYYKGLKYLIEAMKGINATLLIISTGKLEQELKRQADGMKNILFLGKVDELEPYYHACDFFVLPSIERSEAFGIVQMEAMACGKPVISTKLNTGVEFVNQHEKTGLIVQPKDSDALHKAIVYLLENPEIIKKYGGYAKKRIEKDFTKEIVAEKVLNIYQDILSKNQRDCFHKHL